MEMIIGAVAIILIIIAFFIGKKFASKPIDDNNNQIREEKQKLEEQIKNKQIELTTIEFKIAAGNDKLISTQQQYQNSQKTIQNTKQLAEDAAKQRTQVLEYQYRKQEQVLQEQINKINKQKEQVQQELDSLKETKRAAIEAARKEQQIKDNKENYCLILSIEEQNDIKILESVRSRISKPRAVSMIIWSNYYQIVAKKKFPQILGKQDVVGVYKITNLKTGECYIGQSTDCRKRWYQHCQRGLGVDTPQGNKLYAAMQEYGLNNFSFELLLECKGNELDEKEKYFIELYAADTQYNSTKGNS